MYSEDDFLPISALQHLVFCPRQCALIHLERIWDENKLTAEGRVMHEKVHDSDSEFREGIYIAKSVRLHSYRLGLSGQADVVEFHRIPKECLEGISLKGINGKWQAFPVEYKRGKPKKDHCDIVQLCAQAICLEEMLDIKIPKGALFYGRPRRRQEVIFDENLRRETEDYATRLHMLIADGKTPSAHYESKCKKCSLYEICMPKIAGIKKNIGLYLANAKVDEEEMET
jgi:CRISPR-associated exonuclease Cas4